jgi:predicted Zn-dependent protease
MLKKIFSAIVFIHISLFTIHCFAQETKTFCDQFADFNKAVELMEHQQYKAALNEFNGVLQQFPYYGDNRFQHIHTEAQFFAALCAIELDEPQGEQQMKDFLQIFSTNTRDNDAKYELGKLNFKQNKYKDVIAYLENVDHSELKQEEISNSKFYLAYAYFFTKKLDKALPLFATLSSSQNKYYYPANYYAGFISMNNKDYSSAEKHFEKAAQASMYESVIPYYLSQTYFAQKKYDAVLAYAPVQLEKRNLLYKNELQYLVGQSYFMKKNYALALPFLESNAKANKKMYPKDFYQLAYAQYQTQAFADAVLNLKELDNENDSLGQ